MKITPVQNTPLNRLFLALNHYISTGDRVGEGLAIPGGNPKGTTHQVLIPHQPGEATDAADWEKLRARLAQLEAEGQGFKLTDEGFAPGPSGRRHFHIHALHVPTTKVLRLTALLREKPGPLGWGSFYDLLRTHGLTDEEPEEAGESSND